MGGGLVANGWEMAYCKAQDPRRDAWRTRAVPPPWLWSERDTLVWIDASFTLTDLPRLLSDAGKAEIAALRHQKRKSCYEEGKEIVRVGQASSADVRRQLDGYRKAGYPGMPLSISCVIVRQHTAKVQAFNETWAAEIAKHPGDNTQLSLDYSAWTQGLQIKALSGTRHDNPYATHDHDDHKKRRKPYATEVAR